MRKLGEIVVQSLVLMWSIIMLPESYGVLEGEEYDDECVDGVEGDGDEGGPVGKSHL